MTRLRNFRNNSGLNNGVLLSSCTSSYELSSNLNDSVTSIQKMLLVYRRFIFQ